MGKLIWSNDRSVILTQCIIKICYVILTVVSVGLPFIFDKGFYTFDILGEIKSYVIGPFYAVVPAGYAALICLDKLLINIKWHRVFVSANVKLLRILSWACVYAATVGFISFIVILLKDFMFETMFILSAGEFFVALIVRVVKNVFEKAIEIKEENDLTV